MNIGKTIKQFRTQKGISQEMAATELGITRQTYLSIENSVRQPNLQELRELSDLFGITIEELIKNTAPTEPTVTLPGESRKSAAAQTIRINVPQKNLAKFKETLLYVLSKIGAVPHVGETVIYKILYFIDFDYYEKYEEQLIGATYIKNKFGPTPVEFKKIVENMIQKNELAVVRGKHFQYNQRKYLPIRKPDTSIFTGREIEHINEVIARLGEKNARQLSEYSHEDVPWLSTQENDKIEYESVFYRTPKTSVRNYES